MRLTGFVVTVVLLSAGLVPGQTAETPDDLKKLEGHWLVAHRAMVPAKIRSEVARRLTDLGTEVEITDGKLVACDKDKKGRSLNLVVDPNTNPKSIDLKVPGKKDQVMYGIYRLDGDVLHLVVGIGKDRPGYFKYSYDQVLLILKRKRANP